MRLAVLLAIAPGCSLMLGHPLTAPGDNPRAKLCTILDKTVGVDAVATIVTTAVAMTGVMMRESNYEAGHSLAIDAAAIGAPFFVSFSAATFGRTRCLTAR